MQTEQKVNPENFSILKPRKALNKAFLKVKPNRSQIEQFKENLKELLDRTNDTESEEFHKNLGGDLSLLNLSQTGKGQLVEAIRVLKLGGGGNITIDSLISVVAEEYGGNKDVKELL